MGSISSMAKMLPGMGAAMQGIEEGAPEKEMQRLEAMILSMTPAERKDASILNGSRRKRIAKGSGNTVEELNKMLKQFEMMRKIMKEFSGGGMGKDLLRSMTGMMKGPR